MGDYDIPIGKMVACIAVTVGLAMLGVGIGVGYAIQRYGAPC